MERALDLEVLRDLVGLIRNDQELRHEVFQICNDNSYALIDIEFWKPAVHRDIDLVEAERDAVEQFRLLTTAPIPVQGGGTVGGTPDTSAHTGDGPTWDELLGGYQHHPALRTDTEEGYHYDFTKSGPEDHAAIDKHLGIKPAHFPQHVREHTLRGPATASYRDDDPHGLRSHPDGT